MAQSPFPFPLRPLGTPLSSSVDGDAVTIVAGPRTDWFVDPGLSTAKLDAPGLVGATSGDFQFSACVEVEFAATFDAGVLAVWRDEQTWAKLCFEYSPDREAMVVSVVTRATSDDCNSTIVDDTAVWLRIARIGRQFAFHASTDGALWRLVRNFALTDDEAIEIGFVAQSPLGEGCTATFSEIRFSSETLANLRSGE